MALLFECMGKCCRNMLDTADIVREACFRLLRWHAQTSLYDQGRGHARYVAHHGAFCHSDCRQWKGVCGDPAESGGLWIIPGLTDGGGKQPNSYCKHCASGGAKDKGG